MKNIFMAKSYPPEKLSYPHKFRVWAFALLFVLVFAFTGCTDSTEPPVEVETGTTRKFYDLYEPISQLENIECDLYYEYHTARLAAVDSKTEKVTTKPYMQFGTQTVDIWRTYKLEVRQNGAFCIDFATSFDPIHSTDYGLERYSYTASINYNNLQNENLISTLATQVDRSSNKRQDFNAAWDGDYYDLDSTYYCTWVVDGMQTKHRVDYKGQLDRIWNIRLYVLFVDSETTVTLHEYIFRAKFPCIHDENGNEIYEGYSNVYSADGTLIEEGQYWSAGDKWVYDRYVSQSYTPPV